MNIELLNKVQRLLIDQASAAGINLADEFANADEFKKFVIGAAFKGLRDAGASTKDAYDAVMGAGAYDALAGEVFEQLAA